MKVRHFGFRSVWRQRALVVEEGEDSPEGEGRGEVGGEEAWGSLGE